MIQDLNIKTLEYNGFVVFKKQSLPQFKRMNREYASNEACFAFVNEGDFQIRGQTQLVKSNKNIGLLAKCVNYYYENLTPEPLSENAQVIGVFLFPDVFTKIFNYDFSLSTYEVDYNLKQVEVDKLLEHFRDSVNILLDNPELADEQLIENKLREFVLLMSKKVGAPSQLDFLASMFKPNFAKFEEVIQSHLYSDLSVDELAKLCHMSVSTFKRKFKDVYGDTPSKHITKLKIEKAQLLLKAKESRITDIVYQTGFESVSTFNRAFKTHTGQSPSQYRLDVNAH